MDRHKSAMKRNRQNIVRRARNRSRRSYLRNQIREMYRLIETGDLEKATAFFPTLKSTVDSATTDGTIHRNKAARHKTRFAKKLQDLSEAEKKLVM